MDDISLDFAPTAFHLSLVVVTSITVVVIAGQIAIVRTISQRLGAFHKSLQQILQGQALTAADEFKALKKAHAERNTQISWICDMVEELRDRETLPLYMSAAGGTKLHTTCDAINEENLVEIRVDRAGYEALLESKLMAAGSCGVFD